MSGFADLRVIDFTGELGPYAGRLFAGLGADVIHLEPLRGDPLRERGPFYRNLPGPERSLAFLYYNAGKRGFALDLEKKRGAEIFLRLCQSADLLIESTAPDYLDGLGIGFAAVHRVNPRLVHTAITPFGHSGPYRDHPGTDLTCSALGGFLFLAGVEAEKPVRACDNQAYRMAEAYAAVGSAVALFHARQTGAGQFVDVSCIEAVATALENAPQYFDLEGKIRRGRGREAGTGTIHPCEDGFVVLVAIMGRNKAMWDAFLEWMKTEGVEEWETFQDKKWIDPAYRSSPEAYETFCRIFERYTLKHGKMHLYETGQSFRVAVTPVSNGKDLLENPQLNYRGFWQTLRHDSLHLHNEIQDLRQKNLDWQHENLELSHEMPDLHHEGHHVRQENADPRHENLDVHHGFLDVRKQNPELEQKTSGGEIIYPGAPVRFGRLTWKIDCPAPRFGQHTAEILRELGYSEEDVQTLSREKVACLESS